MKELTEKQKETLFHIYLLDEHENDLYVEHQIEDLFCDFLDELYPALEVCGYCYTQSELLKNTDPIAFRCAMSDWVSEEFTELGTFENPTRTYYIRNSDLEGFRADFEETLEDGEV